MKAAVVLQKAPPPRTELKRRIVETYDTLGNFAWVSKCSIGTVSTACSGHSNTPMERRQAWAELLGCKVKDIFPED